MTKRTVLERLAEAARDEDMDILEGERSDEIDLASAEILQDFSLRLRSREARLARKIQQALARMDGGSFGVCEECEEPIGIARLRARPEASLCIACKEDQEKRESGFVH
jgi:DnaK suppressor protein